MRVTPAKFLGVAAAALALAGCGSGGGGEVGGQGGGDGPEGTAGAAYEAAFEFCKPGVEAMAAQWGTEPTPEAVTNAIVDMVAANEEDEDEARRGCMDALKETPK